MKKFVRFFIGTILCLTAVLAVGCGGKDSGGGNGNTAISRDEWSSSITDTGFVVEVGGYTAMKIDQNDYETYALSGNTAYVDRAYLGGTYEVAKEGGEWQQIMQPIDQTTYQYNVSGLKGIIKYVQTNYSAFTYDGAVYTMALEGDILSTELENIKDVLGKSYLMPIGLQVKKDSFATANQQKNYVSITIVDQTGGLNNVVITLQNPVLQYTLDKAEKNLTNFVIKGGPSRDDIDYLEAYFTQDGFRVYTPNNTDPLRRDAYLRYDATENKYYEYRQDAQGVWYIEETTAVIYENTKNQAYNLYFGNILEQSEKLVCDYDSHRCYNREVITNTSAMGTWSYFNFEMPISNTFALNGSAKWKMQLKQGQAQSLVYDITLDIGGVTLEYPQVA